MKIKRAITILCIGFLGMCNLEGTLEKTVLFSADAGIRKIGIDSRTSSFNEMVVRHAKRLCNGDSAHVVARDGRDFIDFWLTASEVNLDLEKAYTCLRLFYNNIKWCEVIDYTVVEYVLKGVPKLFERYFEEKKSIGGEFATVRDSVEDMMLGRFTDQLDYFHTKPDIFITKLSGDITDLVKSRLTMIQQEDEAQMFQEKLRNLVIRFSEHMIGKLIWYENDYQRIWPSFIAIADSLHTIGTRGIITDQDNLDELWDSLVKRFVWYLDFRGAVLPVEFYEQIEDDLKNNVVFFLEIDEQDDGIRSKKDIVAQAIVKAKAKALAFEQGGLVTDQLA